MGTRRYDEKVQLIALLLWGRKLKDWYKVSTDLIPLSSEVTDC